MCFCKCKLTSYLNQSQVFVQEEIEDPNSKGTLHKANTDKTNSSISIGKKWPQVSLGTKSDVLETKTHDPAGMKYN